MSTGILAACGKSGVLGMRKDKTCDAELTIEAFPLK
jgi:hypothetical protein